MNPAWLLRARRWAQHPPSAARIKLVLAVVAVCAGLFLLERGLGWPDWLTPERPGRTLR